MMPADYDEDEPARSSGDPMAEFHAERPAIDPESWEDRLNEQKEGDRSRLRSDTSDEEFLDTLSYCGQCGSDACWREKDACRLLQKASLQKLLLAGFLADVPVQSGMSKFVKGRIADFMLQASTEILQTCGRRVTERQQMKLSNYARKQKRQRGEHDLQFDVEKMLAPEITPGYESIARFVNTSSLSLGGTALTMRKLVDELVNRGQE